MQTEGQAGSRGAPEDIYVARSILPRVTKWVWSLLYSLGSHMCGEVRRDR